MRTCAAVLTAVALLWFAGCTTVGVDSIPQGAKVIVDGKWNGTVTPAEIRVRDLPRGTHTITVEKEGYKLLTPPPQVAIVTDGVWILMTCVPPAGPVGILPAELFGNLWTRAEDTHGQASFGQMSLALDTAVLLKETPDAAPGAPKADPENVIRHLGARDDPLDVPFSIEVHDMPLDQAMSALIAEVNKAQLDSVKAGVIYFARVNLVMDNGLAGRVTCNLPYTTFKDALDVFLRPNSCAWTCSKEHRAKADPFEIAYAVRVTADVKKTEAVEISTMKPDLPTLLVAKESSLTVARWRNEMLADAKSQQLPKLLHDSKTPELIDLASKIQYAILDCAHESEALKEQAQKPAEAAPAAGQQDVNELGALSKTMKERVELLKPILAAINEEIANRSK